jgi:hypothetical protein
MIRRAHRRGGFLFYFAPTSAAGRRAPHATLPDATLPEICS